MADEASKKWYAKEGLRFTCTQCGDCCHGEPGFVWVNDEEIVELAELTGETVADFEQKYVRSVDGERSLIEKEGGACVFYEHGMGCTVYDSRPRQCRTWPFWESNVRTPATWKATCRICPGSGVGKLFTAEEILARTKIIEL